MTNPTYTDEQVLKCANTYEGYGEPVCPAMLRSLVKDRSILQLKLESADSERQRLQAEVEALRTQHEEVVCEVIGHVEDGNDGPRIDWTIEGGIHDLPPGLPIFAIQGHFDIEDGWASLYARATPNETKEAKS